MIVYIFGENIPVRCGMLKKLYPCILQKALTHSGMNVLIYYNRMYISTI